MHRILIIGTGSIGERHVRCMLATGRATVGICEPDTALREQVRARYDLPATFAHLDDALNESWDAAVIATPAPLHIPMARQLAEAGIALLIEKPLAVSGEGVEQLLSAVERQNLPAAVAYVYRAHPAVQEVREAIRDGRFGKPLQITVQYGENFPHHRPAYRDIYYARRDQGGGLIQDGLTHLFNTCEWFVGPITRIAVDAATQHLEGVECEDTAHALARHSDTVMVSYACNHYQAPAEIVVGVVCESGTMRLELARHMWKWMSKPDDQWHEQPTGVTQRDDVFVRQAHAFCDYLENRAPPLCTLREGWQTLLANRAALASARHFGCWQRVDSVAKLPVEC